MARFDSVLSFSRADPDADQPTNHREPDAVACDDEDDDSEFEFAFAPPLSAAAGSEDALLAPADDLFAHGRILPAYPVFDLVASSAAPPSPDLYCAWAPRSAPGSPAREFPKSASTGEARRFWRLRDLVGGRSHSDGKEKFVFLQPAGNSVPAAAAPSKIAKMAAAEGKKQSKKKGGVTEMDMATAHKLFYGKQGGVLPGGGGERRQPSYLPYRTGIVGFFASAHALGRSHHPY